MAVDEIRASSEAAHSIMARGLRESLSRELDRQLAQLKQEYVQKLDEQIHDFKRKVLENVVLETDKDIFNDRVKVSFAVDIQTLAKDAGLTGGR